MSRAGGKVSSSSIKAAGGVGPSRRAVLGGVLAVGAALPLGGCDLFNDTVRYRTKLILEVETPSGLRQGASVVEWYYSVVPQAMRKFYFPDACCAWGGIEKGEATVVDLGDGKYLFATLKDFGSIETGIERAGVPFNSPSKIRKAWRKMRKGEIPRRYPLQPDDLPLLVTFTDIDDPKTVKRVDPWDMDAAFACDRDTGPKPWREQGISVRLWHKQQMAFRAAREVTQEMGLSPEAGEVLARMQFSRPAADLDDIMKGVVKQLGPMEEWDAARARLKALGVDGETWNTWEKRFLARYEELATQPPRDTSRDCHRLKAAWVEITDEPATTGRVEKVLPCLKSGKACVPLNEKLPFGHPMRNILNSAFWRNW